MKLFVAQGSPRLAGLNGTLKVSPQTPEQVSALIYENRNNYTSLITFEETCDSLALLAGIPRFHRKRKADGDIDFRLRDGDVWLVVSVKDTAWKKERHSLGVFDFEFTKCVYTTEVK